MRCGTFEHDGTCQESEGDHRVRTYKPFTETIAFLTESMGRKVVLAGGCIRDTWIQGSELIKDYDAWVLGVKESEIQALDQQATDTLHPYMSHTTHSASAPDEVCIDYPKRKFHCAKANLHFPWIPDGKPVQLIYTPEVTMQDLVSRFDWRVCSFGFDGETVISDGCRDFEEKTLTLNPDNALRSARSTLRRGFRLEDKFRGTAHRLNLRNESILALAAVLVLSAEDPQAEKVFA